MASSTVHFAMTMLNASDVDIEKSTDGAELATKFGLHSVCGAGWATLFVNRLRLHLLNEEKLDDRNQLWHVDGRSLLWYALGRFCLPMTEEAERCELNYDSAKNCAGLADNLAFLDLHNLQCSYPKGSLKDTGKARNQLVKC